MIASALKGALFEDGQSLVRGSQNISKGDSKKMRRLDRSNESCGRCGTSGGIEKKLGGRKATEALKVPKRKKGGESGLSNGKGVNGL